MKKTIIFLGFILSLSTSCASDSEADVIEQNRSKNITYSKTIKPIITQSCATTGCHNSITKASNLDLSTFEKVKFEFENTSSNGALARIESGNMPKGASKLSDATIETLKDWIAANYPN